MRGVGANFFVGGRGHAIDAALPLQFEAVDADGSDSIGFISTGAGSFFGVVSTGAIQSLVVNYLKTDETDYYSAHVDNVVLGTAAAVPEPASYALMLGGLAALGAFARRRRPR